MRSILLCGFLVACGDAGGDDGSGDDSGGGGTLDADGDGYETPADCDDGDGDIHPEMAEACDGIDQDCDGQTDENPTNGTSFYPDEDGDGFGSSKAPVVSCSAPTGYADNSDDCDDTNAQLNPSTPWYTDDDGDGYGTVLVFAGCFAPSDTAGENGDCDDTNADNHPGADETCDKIDNDCDGTVDDDPVNAHNWYVDGDGDGYGDPDLGVFGCWLVGDNVDNAADCNDADATIHPGATESCDDSLDSDCSGRPDNGCTILYSTDADHSYVGASSRDRVGESLTSLGDVGGDGQDDLVFSAPYAVEETYGFTEAGAVFIAETPGDGINAHVADDTDVQIFGDGTQDEFGLLVEYGGDVNADGVVDLVVGSQNDDINVCRYCGDVRIFLGPIADGLVQGDADIQVPGDQEWSNFGDHASSGDFDSDGIDDVIVAGTNVYEKKGSYSEGLVAFFSGPVDSGVLDTAKAAASFRGDTGSACGAALTTARDADGDGLSDIAVGCASHDLGAGTIFLFLGPISGALDTTMADVEYGAADPGDRLGTGARWGGDLDGDGTLDLLASAQSASSGSVRGGATYVLYGPLDTSLDADDAEAWFEGSSSNSGFGSAIDGESDVDGDGFLDVLIGASSDDSYDKGAGAAYLFYGPFAGPRGSAAADVIVYGDLKDQAGDDVEILDFDGDGAPDVATGAPNSAGSTEGNGRVYLFGATSFL